MVMIRKWSDLCLVGGLEALEKFFQFFFSFRKFVQFRFFYVVFYVLDFMGRDKEFFLNQGLYKEVNLYYCEKRGGV